MESNKKIAKGLSWKLLERFGVMGGQFILQVILARLLDPEHYGMLSLMVVFTTLANVFIQRGFSSALVQNKDVTEEDYSSVFWVTTGVALVIYVGLFTAAPLIATFYEMPDFTLPFRVLCLMLFPGGLNSIQHAIVNRKLRFDIVFRSNLLAIIISGVCGIVLAAMGAGIWALVAQNLLNTIIACVIMWITITWRPRLVCNWKRVKVLFSYGWKILASGLLNSLYTDLRSLVIGIKYDSGMLGFYNRGKQFPQFFANAIDGAIHSVLLPVMSSEQDDKSRIKALTRNSVMLSSYVVFPLMAGLAGVATPLVQLLLTDKWLECVPFLQIYCFTFAFYPIHTSNLQAINAMGRSDIYLYLEVIKKVLGIVILTIAVVCFQSPIAIAMTGVVNAFTSSLINAFPNRRLIKYSFLEQMKDIIPAMLAALLMFGVVLSIQMLDLPIIVTLLLQVVVGVVSYVVISVAFRLEPFKMLLTAVKQLHTKKN